MYGGILKFLKSYKLKTIEPSSLSGTDRAALVTLKPDDSATAHKTDPM